MDSGLWTVSAALLVTGIASLALANQPGASSANYTIIHRALDEGGGRLLGTGMMMDVSLGGVGGISQGAAGATIRHGHAGQLNDAPLAQAESLERRPGGGGKIAVAQLLAQASDLEADAVSLQSFDPQSAEGGTVTLDNGWLLYLPPAGFNGPDGFSYWIEDIFGGLAAALVTVLVTPGDEGGPGRNIALIFLGTDGRPVVQFAGVPGRRLRVQWTDSLEPPVSWSEGAVLMVGPNGILEYHDQEPPPSSGQRYYRVVPDQP